MKHSNNLINVVSAVSLILVMLLGFQPIRSNAVEMEYDANLYSAVTTSSPNFSYHDYIVTLKKFVNKDGLINYKGLKKDHKSLDNFLLTMARLDINTYKKWDEKAKIAFWSNAYNSLTLKLIMDRYPIKVTTKIEPEVPGTSILQIPDRWNTVQFLVMGRKLTLDQIENCILRGQDKEMADEYGHFYEPRVHMDMTCAGMSCPPLRPEPYLGSKLDKQLDEQTRTFLANPSNFRIDRRARKVYVSRILGDWFPGDFVKAYAPKEGFPGHTEKEKAFLNFCAKHISAKDAQYLKEGHYDISVLLYDWTLNQQQ